MPALNATLRKDSPAGYAPTTAQPAVPPPSPLTIQQGRNKANPSIRTPLPPFNADADNLRQFDDSNQNVPRRRVVPLPRSTGVGGTVTNTTNTTVITSGGSSGASTSLTAKTVVITSPVISSGSASFQVLPMKSKSFQLISVSANVACEIRLYGSSAAMAADASRAMDDPPAAEWANNIISDIVLDTVPYSWAWQNRVGCNSENPQNPQAYVAVTNLAGGSAAIQLNLVFLPLESL